VAPQDGIIYPVPAFMQGQDFLFSSAVFANMHYLKGDRRIQLYINFQGKFLFILFKIN
jgi:hypothetical protein